MSVHILILDSTGCSPDMIREFMFLFTDRAKTAAQPTVNEALPHAVPLKKASRATGVSFDYLAKTAERESGFNPQAKAPTSSATGMFQFLEQTWLGMVKTEGGKLGLAEEAAAISSDNGRLSVSDPALRQKILGLREDPSVSALMAGAFAAKNGQKLQEAIGRKPTEGEVYLAHFLGPTGARDLIGLVEKTPDVKAAGAFREAAAANRNVFFDKTGRAKTAGEVYSSITSAFGQTQVAAPQSAEAAAARSVDMYRIKEGGKPMHGLFRSNGEAVADSVKQTWGNIGQVHRISGEQRVPFHPTDVVSQSRGLAKAPVASVMGQPAASQALVERGRGALSATLPQARPTGMDVMSAAQNQRAQRSGRREPTSIEGGASVMPPVRNRPGLPLDLRQFVKAERIP